MTIPDTVTRERLDLEEMKRRAELTTPGEWYETIDGYVRSRLLEKTGGSRDLSVARAYNSHGPGYDDASFIAYANPRRVLALIEMVRELKDRVTQLECERDDFKRGEDEIHTAFRKCQNELSEARAKVRELAAPKVCEHKVVIGSGLIGVTFCWDCGKELAGGG